MDPHPAVPIERDISWQEPFSCDYTLTTKDGPLRCSRYVLCLWSLLSKDVAQYPEGLDLSLYSYTAVELSVKMMHRALFIPSFNAIFMQNQVVDISAEDYSDYMRIDARYKLWLNRVEKAHLVGVSCPAMDSCSEDAITVILDRYGSDTQVSDLIRSVTKYPADKMEEHHLRVIRLLVSRGRSLRSTPPSSEFSILSLFDRIDLYETLQYSTVEHLPVRSSTFYVRLYEHGNFKLITELFGIFKLSISEYLFKELDPKDRFLSTITLDNNDYIIAGALMKSRSQTDHVRALRHCPRFNSGTFLPTGGTTTLFHSSTMLSAAPSTIPSVVPSVVPSTAPPAIPSTAPPAIPSAVPSTASSAAPSTLPSNNLPSPTNVLLTSYHDSVMKRMRNRVLELPPVPVRKSTDTILPDKTTRKIRPPIPRHSPPN